MKKKILIAGLSLLLLFLIYFIGTGFSKNTSVYVKDFSVSGSGKEITIYTGVSSPIGYIRDISTHQQDNTLYLDFYSAFGGLNGNIGAKNKFTLPLNDDVSIISIYNLGTDHYEDILYKDENGIWQRVNVGAGKLQNGIK